MRDSTFLYKYEKEIIDKLITEINLKPISKEKILIPAYSYLAESLRELELEYEKVKLTNADIILYDSEVAIALELMQNMFALYYLEVPLDIINFKDLFVENCMSLLQYEILDHISNHQMKVIEDIAYKPDKISLLSGHMIALQNKIVWLGYNQQLEKIHE